MEIRYWGIGWMSRKDGPGNRVVVYLQGCPGNCPWCHSPHSRYREAPLMFQKQFCVLCGRCATACPNGVHKINEEHILDRSRCTRCGKCIQACMYSGTELPNSPLLLLTKQRDVRELFEEIFPQLEIVQKSGGITLSGGEALSQPAAAVKMLTLCREHGIHTCVETSMILPEQVYADAAAHVDHWLLGFREGYLPDTENRSAVMADYSRKIKRMRDGGASGFTARFPIISGYTDREEALQFLRDCLIANDIRELEIFPCNPHTKHYYELTGESVPADIGSWIPDAGRMTEIQNFFQENRLHVNKIN